MPRESGATYGTDESGGGNYGRIKGYETDGVGWTCE